MGMTLTEKILASHSGRPSVAPGDLITAKLDLVLANDITAPVAINEFEAIGAPTVYDKERVVLVPDHFTPNKDIKAAEQAKMVREFAHKHEITNYFEVGRMGIEHCLLPEQGLVGPGDVIIGADSHTCTYGALGAFSTGVGSTDAAVGMATGEAWFKVPESIRFVLRGKHLSPWVSGKDLILKIIGDIGVDGALYSAMEFSGEGVGVLSMDDRFTIANMAIEAGAKNGIFPVDEVTLAYVTGRAKRPFVVYDADADAHYAKEYVYDLESLEPQVAFPHLPENTRAISEVGDVEIHQSVIGSCTNGRISDLRVAAKVLEGRQVHKNVRCIIFPGTQQIWKQALNEGLFDIFIDAGAVVSTPTCGPCLGGHMGILAKGERAISTTNRNFVGRMGHVGSEVYLSNPAVAAASAVLGRIADPAELMREGGVL